MSDMIEILALRARTPESVGKKVVLIDKRDIDFKVFNGSASANESAHDKWDIDFLVSDVSELKGILEHTGGRLRHRSMSAMDR